MSSQAERRAALRKRQTERDQRTARRVRLARLRQLANPWPDDPAQLEALALAAVKAEPDGMPVEDLHPRLLEHLVERHLVAVFRGRVVERGHA